MKMDTLKLTGAFLLFQLGEGRSMAYRVIHKSLIISGRIALGRSGRPSY
jgi:hypothetical protein